MVSKVRLVFKDNSENDSATVTQIEQSGDSPVPKISAPQWTPFTVNLLFAKDGCTSKTCYVGS